MIDLSLLEDFVMGAGESLEEMEAALLTLESTPDDNELLNTIFRAIHTIKGAAQFVGLERASALSHALEDLLDLLREGKKQVTIEIIALLIQAKDRITLLVTDLERSQTEETEVNDLIAKLNVHLGLEPVEAPSDSHEDASVQNEEELTSFLSNDEELTPFLSEEEVSDDIASFLSDDALNTDSFLLEDKEQTTVSSFLEETNENEATSSFLSEDDLTLGSFLSEAIDEQENNSFNLNENNQPPLSFELDKNLKSPTDEEFSIPEEEYDQELFGIFISQLEEQFSVLKGCLVQPDSFQHKKELLETVLKALESLKFSANYMTYEKLTHFYAGWIHKVVNVKENLHVTDELSLTCIKEYLLRLQTIFPQLKENKVESDYVAPKKVDAVVTDVFNEKNISGGELAFINNLEVRNKQSPLIVDKPKKESIDDNDGDLFDRLSSALDASVIEQSITSVPINEVFSSLLDSTVEHRKHVNVNKDKGLVLDVKTLAEANKEPFKPVETSEVLDVLEPKRVVEDKTSVGAKIEPPSKPDIVKPSPTKTDDKKATAAPPATGKVFKKSIRVDADKIDSLMNQVGELIVDRAYFFQLATEISELQQYLKETGLGQKDLKPVRTFAYRFSEAIISLGRTSNELQEGVMKVRMLPVAQIFNRFPRLVHDVANTNNKKVNLDIRGEETELDKMIIEEVADPLMHMIRNAIGHGIELPEDRIKAGKPEIGTLVLEAFHESNHIVIEVTDDGRGIDVERIKVKAEQMELFTRDELDRMSTNDLTRFIMMPGFSTAKEISSTSGRGVGMDVVKKNIEKLNGTIEVESKKGIETKMRLKIPLTLAIIPALLVKVGVDSFTIPLANVEETLRVEHNEVSIMEETEVMYLRGKTVPIFRLATLFSLKSDSKMGLDDFFVVIVNTGTQKIGLMVDALIGQEEVVIKPLADYLYEQNCFSGATIIGDGRISLILDIYELINMTTDKQIKMHRKQEQKSLATLGNKT
ncbi:MAG: chemotaxis protein CheA [Methylococcales bacterium]|nr:chemotaxis protein CheA [Methylococcales bacterium]